MNDREQQILAEIEKRFYEEDPDLAEAVRDISKIGRWGISKRWAIGGVVLGLVILVSTFTVNRWFALGGFLLIVLSGTAFATTHKRKSAEGGEPSLPSTKVGNWLAAKRLDRRFRRNRRAE